MVTEKVHHTPYVQHSFLGHLSHLPASRAQMAGERSSHEFYTLAVCTISIFTCKRADTTDASFTVVRGSQENTRSRRKTNMKEERLGKKHGGELIQVSRGCHERCALHTASYTQRHTHTHTYTKILLTKPSDASVLSTAPPLRYTCLQRTVKEKQAKLVGQPRQLLGQHATSAPSQRYNCFFRTPELAYVELLLRVACPTLEHPTRGPGLCDLLLPPVFATLIS